MNYLVDTLLLLRAAFRSEDLSEAARRLLEDPRHGLWFSAASIWEVTVKRELNRPDFRVDAGLLRAGLLANGYQELAILGRHCLAPSALPDPAGDPFDRMLLAQAVTEGMILMTADARLAGQGRPVTLV